MALKPTINEVYDFWQNNPLFQGEGQYEVGSKLWFEEWEQIIIQDCFAGQEPEAIYTKGLQSQSKILDVGCGPGFWVRYFLKKGFANISACDLTDKAVELAKLSLETFQFNHDAEIKQGNAEEFPYPDNSFDHINCQGVIHHTPNTEKCLTEFYRVLKKHGSVCFSVYHKNIILRQEFIVKIISQLFSNIIKLKGRGREELLKIAKSDEIVRRYDGMENPIGKAFTKKDILKMCNGLFKITETKYHFFPARALPLHIPKKLHKLLHNHFGFMIVAYGVKA